MNTVPPTPTVGSAAKKLLVPLAAAMATIGLTAEETSMQAQSCVFECDAEYDFYHEVCALAYPPHTWESIDCFDTIHDQWEQCVANCGC